MKHLGIIIALLPEARCFVKAPLKDQLIVINQNISLIVCGMGQQRAEAAARQLLDLGANALLVTGTCGALSPALKPGDFVIPEDVITDTQSTLPVSKVWHQSACELLAKFPVPIHTQTLLSTARLIEQSVEKDRLHKTTGALAVDMESAAILTVAESRQLPALVLRTVIDPSRFTIPDFIIKNSDPYGDTHLYSLIKSCIVNTRRLMLLLHMASYYRNSKKSLKCISTQLEALAEVAG